MFERPLSKVPGASSHGLKSKESKGRTSVRRPRPQPLDDVAVALASLRQEVADLRHELLRRITTDTSGPIAAWLPVLHRAMNEQPFTAAGAMKAAAPVLLDSLQSASIFKPAELGWRLRGLSGVVTGGLRVERLDDSRAGARWRVLRVSGREGRAPLP
jgi:hypothetical protein